MSQFYKNVTLNIKFGLFLLVICFGFNSVLKAQEIAEQDGLVMLSLEEAIRIGLNQNFGIRIARNNAEIASLNRNYGAAGFFPSVNATGNFTGGEDDVVITTDGIEQSSVRTTNSVTNMDVALDWTIFDGFKMFTTYNKLKEFEVLGQVRAKIRIEDTIFDIINGYYDIVRVGKRLTVLENTVEISEERFRIADTKRQLGSGSEYELLLAQTDLNSDKAAVIREQVFLNDTRIRLLRLLNMDVNTELSVDPEIVLLAPLNLSDVLSGIYESNSQLESANIQYRIAGLERREVLQGRLPTVSLTGGYSVNSRETRNSVRSLQETDAFRYGLTLRIPIVDGFNLNRKLDAVRIYERNAELALEEQFMILKSVAAAEYKNYVSTREVVGIEQENISLANQTLEIALERFYLGTITSLELRESQRTLINTETRLITAQYEAKVSETELLRLMGRLLEN